MIGTYSDWTRRELLRRGGLTGGALVLGGIPLNGSAMANVNGVQHESVDVTGVRTYNPCTDEMLLTTQGTVELVIHEDTDSDGGFHLAIRRRLHDIEAVGEESGITYFVHGGETINQNVRPPYPETFTISNHQRAISRGSAENIMIEDLIRMTVNANGEVTVNRIEISIRCVG